ncbi:hypothetical protein [Erythrobacter sp. WG]|uniref:hypothetical protein n=1 Tax=Erythrobacter sp. WG TaxID=2985510 RepID=UPI002271B86D|nr:hypothetical protein [Erythrobacter sp. WG]MCX9146625.1 hypothetical protein [Erythrobacter sp. WG]
MKTLPPSALAALQAGTAIVTGAVEIACDPIVRVWGGWAPITFDGRTFEPIGDRGLVQVAGGALGDAAQNITLTLSGIEPATLELLEAEDLSGAPAVLWRLIFDQTGNTLLGFNVWARGRLDTLSTEEEVGGTAAIVAQLETAAKGLGRSGGRMRSDADQRLINPSDGFFKNVSYAGEKTLYWGGRRPARAGSSLPGVGGGFGGGIDGSFPNEVAR